jgi:hypothetical protein
MRPKNKSATKWTEAKIGLYSENVYGTLYDCIQVVWIGLVYLLGGGWAPWAKWLPQIGSRIMLMCSELVLDFYKKTLGKDIFEGKINSSYITPGMFFGCQELYPVAFFVREKK